MQSKNIYSQQVFADLNWEMLPFFNRTKNKHSTEYLFDLYIQLTLTNL